MLERRTGDSRNEVGLKPGGMVVMQVDLEIGSFAGDMSLYLAPPPDESRLDSEQSTLLETSGSIFQSRERESRM